MNQDNMNEEKKSCQQEPETAEDAVKAPETEEHMENQEAQDAAEEKAVLSAGWAGCHKFFRTEAGKLVY